MALLDTLKPHRNGARKPKLTGEAFAALINLSGRRRFTSQRLVLYAVLASLGHEDALAVAREALGLFSQAHRTLIEGDHELPGIFCEPLHEVYRGNLQGERKIDQFIALAECCLRALESDAPDAPALLEQLIKAGTPLLALLNRITQVYEEISKEHAGTVKRQMQGIMSDIESIARHARMVSFNAQIVAARAGTAGREFAVVAGVLGDITGEIDALVREAISSTNA